MKCRPYCNLCEQHIASIRYSYMHGLCHTCAIAIDNVLANHKMYYICIVCDQRFSYNNFDDLLEHLETKHQQPPNKLLRPKYRNKLFIIQQVKL